VLHYTRWNTGLSDRELPWYTESRKGQSDGIYSGRNNSVKVLTLAGIALLEFHFNGKNNAMIDLSSLPGESTCYL